MLTEMPDYNAKRGDVGTDIAATLKDRTGEAVSLSGATVKFYMRSFEDGTLVVSGNATVVDAATGKVKYTWASGDLDIAGLYFAEWEVLPGPNTYPSIGYHVINVADDLDSGNDIQFMNVRRLRRMTAELDVTATSDGTMAGYLTLAGGDLNTAAALVWRDKAAGYAELVDVNDGTSSRKLSQLYDRAIAQATQYENAAGTQDTSRFTVIRPIERV